jgi:TPP-dependent pyruvate/acetoin dehydrogenase alpha subunit
VTPRHDCFEAERETAVDPNRLLDAYRLMLLSRAVDDACDDLADRGVPVPNYHGSRGQEAMYAGVGVSLEPQDYLLYNYRAFATLLAKGVSLEELVGDLLMNSRGTSLGHGGIMHVTAPERGIVGRNGVFGSKFGIALGLAQEIVLNKRQAVVACMFGEAEGNRGGLYEAMNVAALRKLPVLFLAENNGYAVAATTDLLYSTGDMSGVVSGFPMPVVKIDGNDVEAVADQVASLAAASRAGAGPAYVECVTARLDPHHAHDDQSKYRDARALEAAWEREPLVRARQRLLDLGRSAQELGHEQLQATERVAAALSSVIDAAPASIELVYSHTYFDGHGAAR